MDPIVTDLYYSDSVVTGPVGEGLVGAEQVFMTDPKISQIRQEVFDLVKGRVDYDLKLSMDQMGLFYDPPNGMIIHEIDIVLDRIGILNGDLSELKKFKLSGPA